MVEKETLYWANQLRTNPQSLISALQEQLRYFQGNKYNAPGMRCPLVTNEGPRAVQECINALRNCTPMKPQTISDGMSHAARDHVNDTGPKGITGHHGSNGSSMSSRLEKHGEWMGSIAENISYGQSSGKDVIQQLIVDDGVMSRGHRKNLLNPNSLRVGIANGAHRQYDTMCVMTFASKYTEGKGGHCGGGSNSYANYNEPNSYPKDNSRKLADQQHIPHNDFQRQKYENNNANNQPKNSYGGQSPKKSYRGDNLAMDINYGGDKHSTYGHSNNNTHGNNDHNHGKNNHNHGSNKNFGGGFDDGWADMGGKFGGDFGGRFGGSFNDQDDWMQKQMDQMKNRQKSAYGTSRNDFFDDDFFSSNKKTNHNSSSQRGYGGGSEGGMIPGAVACIGTSSNTRTVNGHTVQQVTKTYKMKDGSTKTVTS